jgi:hypothetical protein
MQKHKLLSWALRLCLALVVVSATMAAWQAYRWQQAQAFNAQLAQPKLLEAAKAQGQSRALDREAAVMLSLANQLLREAKPTEALALLRDVEAQLQGKTDENSQLLHKHAKFNSANIYLRQAIGFSERGDKAKAVPPTELAKGLYRDVLRSDSQYWDARYNLERALTIVPEQEVADNETGMLPPPGERAVTTMRGVSPGMP